jgi:hypothetical protein
LLLALAELGIWIEAIFILALLALNPFGVHRFFFG